MNFLSLGISTFIFNLLKKYPDEENSISVSKICKFFPKCHFLQWGTDNQTDKGAFKYYIMFGPDIQLSFWSQE